MPESRKERSLDVTVSGGGGGGGTEYTAGTITTDFQAVGAGTVNITAGKYKVKIWNKGVEDITANGDTIPPGEFLIFEAKTDLVDSRQDFTPAIELIVPAGGAATYYTETPSA